MKIQSSLRSLDDKKMKNDELGFVVFFPEELENNSLAARVFAEARAIEASVFAVTEEIMDAFDTLDEKYEKILRRERKSLLEAKKKDPGKIHSKKEKGVTEKSISSLQWGSIEEKKTQVLPKKKAQKKKPSHTKKSALTKNASAQKKTPLQKSASSPNKKK